MTEKMDFNKYKKYLQPYLQMKNYSNFNQNISCFSGKHEDKNPSMKVHQERFKCYSCGLTGDIFDAVGIFEFINDRKEQFDFVENLYGNTPPPKFKKEKFIIDPEAYEIVYNYIKEKKFTIEGEKFIENFVKQRGYSGEKAEKFQEYLGFWTGYNQALKDLGIMVLEKAGIPIPDEDKKYSSWDKAGIVCKFENGFKLMYLQKKDDKMITVKRGSHGSRTFPYPVGLPKENKIGLVEAEISGIMCNVIGLKYFRATGGINGLLIEHFEILKKFDEIILMFDGDINGKKAVELIETLNPEKSIIQKLLKYGYTGTIKIVELPENLDPDDLIRDNRENELIQCIDNAKIYKKKPNLAPENNNNIKDIEQYFFIKNAFKNYNYSRNEIKNFIFNRPELAYQEAAKLLFLEHYKFGIKIQESSTTKMIWLYDENRKYWSPFIPKNSPIFYKAMELFIKKYNAFIFKQGATKKFHFKKENKTRSEIEKNFYEYIQENIKSEQKPFKSSMIKKVISCKNCVLIWNYKKKKFDKFQHSADHNLTVSPFPFNRLDLTKLNEDQIKRRESLREYFYKLVNWVDNEIEDEKEADKEKDAILQFIFAFIGYSLTPWREKCFFVWIGPPDGGKTTLKEILKLIHEDKLAEADFNSWHRQKSPHYNEVLPGLLVIVDDDFEVGGRLPERELKTLSQNNTITINPKHIQQFTITNTAIPLILTNGNPRAEDITLENRMYAILFNSKMSRINRDINTEIFLNYIREPETLEILFNIAIDIAEKTIFLHGNFNEIIPLSVKKLSSQIIDSASSVLMWIDDMRAQGKLNVDSDNENIRIKRTELYYLYKTYYTGHKKGLHAFYESVRQRFKDEHVGGQNYIYGISKILDEPVNLPYED